MIREVGTVILIVFASACVVYSLVHKIKPNLIKSDNVVEEHIEKIIENKTGVKIDLTPDEKTGGFIQRVDASKVSNLFKKTEDK